MLWNRRMFWKVRPSPASTMSFRPSAAEDADARKRLLVADRSSHADDQRRHQREERNRGDDEHLAIGVPPLDAGDRQQQADVTRA
jgi:hypothetical protein